MKKIILIISCYVPVFWGCILYSQLGLAQFFAGGCSFFAGLLILILQKDIREYKFLSLHQFIGAMIAYILSGGLHLYYKSDDFITVAFVVIAVIVGVIGFLIQFGIGYFISKGMKRNR